MWIGQLLSSSLGTELLPHRTKMGGRGGWAKALSCLMRTGLSWLVQVRKEKKSWRHSHSRKDNILFLFVPHT